MLDDMKAKGKAEKHEEEVEFAKFQACLSDSARFREEQCRAMKGGPDHPEGETIYIYIYIYIYYTYISLSVTFGLLSQSRS